MFILKIKLYKILTKLLVILLSLIKVFLLDIKYCNIEKVAAVTKLSNIPAPADEVSSLLPEKDCRNNRPTCK